MRAGSGHVDGVFTTEHQLAARYQCLVQRCDQPWQVFDVVEGERTVGQIEPCCWQREALQISDAVLDRRIMGIVPGTREHVLRQVLAAQLVEQLRTLAPPHQ
ncbi:hypothetical protein BGP80_17060 [Pseudomonas putida]|uniref:Uncharacterized protein n=1 Tax=Pseudomonas putida TaxID=303 RepID=A0A2S3WF63_PSEPU|nr:hypothetical protein BGP80_17060 [Pseudomonas putida]